MSESLKEITQISIYLKEEAERVNEVALFQPLLRKSHFNEESKPIASRKWRYTSNISFFRKIALKLQTFLFKRFPHFIPNERLTPEAQFKTVLAILLAQEGVREFFLSDSKRRKKFLNAVQEAAAACGYSNFSALSFSSLENSPLKLSQRLTQFNGKKSLIDDLVELNLQMAALKHHERSEILYRILNKVERPPITSVIEITSTKTTVSIPLTTKYAKYKVTAYNRENGKIKFSYEENKATSSIRTVKNTLPDAKGAMNQRVVLDENSNIRIGSYSGELSTPFHALEQILLILGQTSNEVSITQGSEECENIEKKKILFTSLYSWYEIGLITEQRTSIQAWDQKILKNRAGCCHLNLLYYNIPFNALNKFPSPGEINATIQDINEETLATLVFEAWEKLGLKSQELYTIAHAILSIREKQLDPFFREKALLREIDSFRRIKGDLLYQIHLLPSNPLILTVKTLLSGKKSDGKALKGIDKLLYLDCLAAHLGYFHNKNCQNATDRSAGADAADKAQFAFKEIFKTPYLPGYAQEEEKNFFKVLYSMYLVWEEPEINTALSTGFLGEKFYNNFFQKNPETTRYLVRWLKKNPEIYLGLSDYR